MDSTNPNVTISMPACPAATLTSDGTNVYRLVVAVELLTGRDPGEAEAAKALADEVTSELGRLAT